MENVQDIVCKSQLDKFILTQLPILSPAPTNIAKYNEINTIIN